MAAWTPEAVIDRDEILSWREEQLLKAGYPHADASELAEDPAVDLHRAVELVERGCTPELARQILL
jgi:hypothetical protein